MIKKETDAKESRCTALYRKVEKEIYENITQCLCLVKMQVSSIELNNKEETRARIAEACLLLGKAVKDLRNLAKQLAASHSLTRQP